ncbi:hypothetical protein NQ318_020618, partial [Aromia moschata]
MLLQSNGSIIETTAQPFSKLKALTYDNIRDQFVVSDTDQFNDTIFTVQLTKETDIDITPIIQDLPDDVQGLAVDPINDLLYWTDAINRTINYVPLNETSYESKLLFSFADEHPHAVAIDVCKRYIYWTNSKPRNPTIERARLDGTGHEVLVDTGIVSPEGLAIDYNSQRLYWADTRDGSIYGRIESTNMEGKEKTDRTHAKPFGVAVDGGVIYWTDTNNNALYRTFKQKKMEPEKLIVFDERPMGLVTNNVKIKDLPDCRDLEEAMEKYKEYEGEKSSTALPAKEENLVRECLNGGELLGNHCKCKRGFIGMSCENSVCQNFCVNGACYTSSLGKPSCRCERGFVGDRCERNKCDDFCLNGGECSISSPRDRPKCSCSEDFLGDRCEYSVKICDLYCRDRGDDLFSEEYELLCRLYGFCILNVTSAQYFWCNAGSNLFSNGNATMARVAATKEQYTFFDKLSDPLYYLTALLSICLLVIVALIVYIRTIRKRRPRIKKRIIVNKNVTPLTYRPQSTEQCEITIENCCNMNVCE